MLHVSLSSIVKKQQPTLLSWGVNENDKKTAIRTNKTAEEKKNTFFKYPHLSLL